MRVLQVLLSAGIAVMSGSFAAAEDANAPAKVAVVLETSVPKLNCPQPKLPAKLLPEDVAGLTKQLSTYTACATQYVSARNAQAQRHNELAKEEATAGNAAVKEINDFYASAKQLAQSVKK
jgi:DNA-binding transcriptional regulator PaaX